MEHRIESRGNWTLDKFRISASMCCWMLIPKWKPPNMCYGPSRNVLKRVSCFVLLLYCSGASIVNTFGGRAHVNLNCQAQRGETTDLPNVTSLFKLLTRSTWFGSRKQSTTKRKLPSATLIRPLTFKVRFIQKLK